MLCVCVCVSIFTHYWLAKMVCWCNIIFTMECRFVGTHISYLDFLFMSHYGQRIAKACFYFQFLRTVIITMQYLFTFMDSK